MESEPTWTRIDNSYENFCGGFEIRGGRQQADEQTDSASATVYFKDTQGYLDSANLSSPLYGLAGKQIWLQAYDPVAESWESQFRGVIDYQHTDFAPSQVVATVALECVGLFDFIARQNMVPGMFGDTPPAGKEGTIFYEDTDTTVDDRIIQILTDCSVPYPDRAVVFTGNVKLTESTYDPGDSPLEALRDCVDAEIPMLANQYEDRWGRYVFHGRESRFDPEAVEATTTADRWTFTRWKVGDGAAIALDADRAQMRVLATDEGRRDVINATLIWPTGMPQEEMADQVYVDATSITDFGYHALPPIQDLQIASCPTTGNTPKVEAKAYGELLVKNMKDPIKRVTSLMVKALGPDDDRAEKTWAIMTRADVSDVIDLKVGYPGGVGIDAEDYYIEGYRKRVLRLNPDYDYMEVEFDISPAVWSMDTHGVFA